MAGPDDGRECGKLKKAFGLCAVGAPTMGNAHPNLNQVEADKMRDRAAHGQAPVNTPGMDKAANAVQQRMATLDNI